MKVTGLITEYNPFHNGHLYHIEKAKELTGADYIIAVMSGNFVQRGTPAIISRQLRTRMALLGGVDLVLELPVNYATASAELFAQGGISVLDGLGVVDSICFGSECGDSKILMDIAEVLIKEPKWYQTALKENLKNGMTYPAARAAALPEYTWVLAEPNNILGIEYCKALLRQNSSMLPVSVLRRGSGYHDTTLDGTYASASAIRENLYSSKKNDIQKNIPLSVFPILEKELQENGTISENEFSQLLLYKLLLLKTPEELLVYADMSEELANRIFKQRYRFLSFSQFADLLKTKELTRTRINRALLHFLLDIRKELPEAAYGRILGFKKSSAELLTKIKQQKKIPLISRPADAETLLNKKQQILFSKSAESDCIYELIAAQKQNRLPVHEFQKQLVIL